MASAYTCFQKELTTTVKKGSRAFNQISINYQYRWFRKMVLTITSNLLWNDQRGQKEPSLVFALSSELKNDIEILHSNVSN